MHGCQGGRAWLPEVGACVAAGGACVAAGGACVAARGGVCGCRGGMHGCRGGMHGWSCDTHAPPPVNRITDRCKNITFAN